jgi:SAM-dependent methyltransferase
LRKSLKQGAKNVLRAVLPLSLRKRIGIALHRQDWLDPESQYWWTRELLRDFAEKEPASYHRYLWSNHMGYAASYNVETRFLKAEIPGSRRIFFSDLSAHLRALGMDPSRDIRSVLEVGCSLGYQLQYMKAAVFPGAVELAGIDIDRFAIEKGKDHLERIGSNVRLTAEDMGNLGRVYDGKRFDVVVCTGVLMYLEEAEATDVMAAMLRICGKIVAISGPAHPEVDNASLDRAVPRSKDGSLIHNLDRIVERAGGTVVARRYEGKRVVDGHTIYFVFARGGDRG